MVDPNESRHVAEWDWVITGNGLKLHAPKVYHDPDYHAFAEGVTECGIETDLHIPGMFTRAGAPRCIHCCRIVGMPEGNGSPKNDDACRPIVRLRVAAFVPNIEFVKD